MKKKIFTFKYELLQETESLIFLKTFLLLKVSFSFIFVQFVLLIPKISK